MNRLLKHPPVRKCSVCGWRDVRYKSGVCKRCRDPEAESANDRHKPTVEELAKYHEWQQSRAAGAGFDIDDGDDRDVMEAIGVLTPFAEWKQRWGTGASDANGTGGRHAAGGPGERAAAADGGDAGGRGGGGGGVVPVVRAGVGGPARGHLPGLPGEADGGDHAGDAAAHPGGHGRAGGGATPGEPPVATTGGGVAADGPADERRAAHAVAEGEAAGAEPEPQDGGRPLAPAAAGDGGPAEGQVPRLVRLKQFWMGLAGEVTVTRERDHQGRRWLLVGRGTRNVWVPAEYTGSER